MDQILSDRDIIEVRTAGQLWKIERTADLETLWESIGEDEFGEDERLPYWAELWPASVLLGEWLYRNAELIKGAKCLDLGCGLGLTAIIGQSLGAEVVAFDYELAPLYFARNNAVANKTGQPLWLQMDWRDPSLAGNSFDFIWGGDILYEKRFFDPLEKLFRRVLKPGGTIWMAEPSRDVSVPVWARLESLGWKTSLLLTEKAACCNAEMTVNIREVVPEKSI
ncbi:class I SAM-dependent methyltransferase [Maridesulfovibrio hydrothermalis]|uniref:Methyltransferase type 11 n=1 Tax=Maridesulfovibrio hydrothermalis AM13 = DSM 14728 TaxID=1121451 RepID=L0RAT1_9BACT|nr:class I SAM-dependent methyltransferase [Maridesulfovibrio hydrothermalis]CCO23859.1 Methyltransferase type 11 [Maridesulfovibrio hydrothermalis AM13 = DSM 14728]